MAVDKSKPLPKKPPVEGTVAKGFRLYNTPVAELIPGAQAALDKQTEVKGTKSEVAEQEMVRQHPVIGRLISAMLNGTGLPLTQAEQKGFVSGAASGVTPALITQAASLGSGAPATIANTAIAAQGGKEALDTNLPWWQRALGGLQAITGGAGAVSGVKKATGAVNEAAQAAKGTTSTLQTQFDSLMQDIKNKVPKSIEDLLKDKYPELNNDVTKKPGGDFAKKIWGEGGKPAPQTPAQVHAQNVADAKAGGKAFDQATKMNQADAAADVQINQSGLADQAAARKATENELNAGFKQADKDAKTAAKNTETERKVRGAAEDQNLKVNKQRQVQAAKEALAKKKQFEADSAQEARNLDAREKAIQAQKQQDIIDAAKAKADEISEGPVRETVKGKGSAGEGQSQTTSYGKKPPDAEGGGGGEGGDGEPKGPVPIDQWERNRFFSMAEAKKYAAQQGHTPDTVEFVRDQKGNVTAIPPKESTKGIPVTPELADALGLPASATPEGPVKAPEGPVGGAAEPPKGEAPPAAAAPTGAASPLPEPVIEGLRAGVAVDPNSPAPAAVPPPVDETGRPLGGYAGPERRLNGGTPPPGFKERRVALTPTEIEVRKAFQDPKQVAAAEAMANADAAERAGREGQPRGGEAPPAAEPPPPVAEPAPAAPIAAAAPEPPPAAPVAAAEPTPEPPVGDQPVRGMRIIGNPETGEISDLERTGEDYGLAKRLKKAGLGTEENRVRAAKGAQSATKAALEGEGPSSDVLSQLPPEQRDSLLAQLMKRVMAQGGGKLGGESGAATLPLSLRLGTGALGGVIGSQVDPDHPLAGAAIGAGTGFLGPDVAARAVPAIEPYVPTLTKGAQTGMDWLNRVHNSMLLSPYSVAKKAAGDVQALVTAGIIRPDRAGEILRQFTTPEGLSLLRRNFSEGMANPENPGSAALENFINQSWNPMSWSGKTMGGLTKATKGVLGEAGFSVPEQGELTMTAEPTSRLGKAVYNATRGSRIAQHFEPFMRMGVNRLERGVDYSPFGLLNPKIAEPGQFIPRATKATLGTLAGLGAYQLVPDDFVKQHPIGAGMLAAGPMGIPIMTGMALKTAKGQNSQGGEAVLKDTAKAAQAIEHDIPGLQLLQNLSGTSEEGFLRNYLSGYTNALRPITQGIKWAEGDNSEPDVSSKNLDLQGRLINRMLSNVPFVEGTLPRKGGENPFGNVDFSGFNPTPVAQ